jgi:hypothetical protein
MIPVQFGANEGLKSPTSQVPAMYSTPGNPMRTKTPSGGTAETLILIGMILQLIGTLAVFLLIAFLGSFLFFFGPAGGAIAIGIGGFVLLLGLFFLYAAYAWCYKRTKEGDYEGAKGWTIILGILGLLFGGVITGILYIIAWVKLRYAVNEQRAAPTMGAPAAPMYGAPVSPTGSAPAGAPPTCPKCGQPGTWVAQYSRYYCYKDQQYL